MGARLRLGRDSDCRDADPENVLFAPGYVAGQGVVSKASGPEPISIALVP
jgi:hypothetical protein